MLRGRQIVISAALPALLSSGAEALATQEWTVSDSFGAASSERLRQLAAARWRVALALTFAMMAIYFGFILLVAFDKALLARTIVPGLSVGILLGVIVIATAWILIAIYVVWANRHYDAAIARLRSER
jgi:uncharacterized membrane protein (DUF485 family)